MRNMILWCENDMTKLEIMSRLWEHINDLVLLARGKGNKSIEQIEGEIDITEMYCRRYVDTDDVCGRDKEAHMEIRSRP